MFGLTAEEQAKLDASFAHELRALIAEKSPNAFALAAAVGVVRVCRFLDLVPQLLTALGATVADLRGSVEDLIAEIQDMRGTPAAPGGEE